MPLSMVNRTFDVVTVLAGWGGVGEAADSRVGHWGNFANWTSSLHRTALFAS